MTEQQWLASDDPEAMLLLQCEKVAGNRKVRLFGCACVRRVWKDLANDQLRKAVEVAELFADGIANLHQLQTAHEESNWLCEGIGDIIADHGPMAVSSLCEITVSYFRAAESTAAIAAEARSDEGASWDGAHAAEQRAQSVVLRDIFGNPFRSIAFDSAWQTATVIAVARAIYDARRFAEMPILADALEEAGCTSAEILDHCCQPGDHARSCWVLDLVRGKV